MKHILCKSNLDDLPFRIQIRIQNRILFINLCLVIRKILNKK